MSVDIEKLSDYLSSDVHRAVRADAAMKQMKFNGDLDDVAREILLPENYAKFRASYRFIFWSQLLGWLISLPIGVIINIIFLLSTEGTLNMDLVVALSLAFMVIVGSVWIIITPFLRKGRVYRKFSKWYRKKGGNLYELDDIFYGKE